MKIVDKTPFLNDKGEISLVDRVKAILKNGKVWMDEVDAQKSVLPVLEKSLDKGYTLLRNITLPDAAASIPLILIGPPGIFVIYVTHLVGMFRAKGDQWGTVDDNAYKLVKPNLLTRTESMARAVQVYLQRHGYNELTMVEPILLCADPRVHVDSLRPIVRVVMRDAVERLALSISQARPVYSPEAVYKLINLFTNPPQPKQDAPPVESAEAGGVEQVPDGFLQAVIPSAIQLPGDELFPRGGPSPRMERSPRVEHPRVEEKNLPVDIPSAAERVIEPEQFIPSESFSSNELPAMEPINPWEEQPVQEKTTLPAEEQPGVAPITQEPQSPQVDGVLPAENPAGEPLFAWEDEPLQAEINQLEEKPAVEPLFPWEEQAPKAADELPPEKSAAEPMFPWEKQVPQAESPLPYEKQPRVPIFPWEEQPSQEEKAQAAEKPTREPLFPWDEPAPKPEQVVKDDQSPWTEEYPQEGQHPGDTWSPQGDQSQAVTTAPEEFQVPAPKPAFTRRLAFSRKQWIFLAAMLFVWFVLVVIFIIKVITDLVL